MEAGIPAAEVLQIATLGAARVLRQGDGSWGRSPPASSPTSSWSTAIPTTRISDIRKVVLTVKDGAAFDTAELYRSVGVKPGV